jgi:FixJ family two-component response regulator
MEEKKARFLIADDEYKIRDTIRKYVNEEGHEADCVSNGEEALRKIYGGNRYDGLFTDLRMPGVDGISLIRALNEEQIRLPLVVVSAFGNVHLLTEAFKKGAVDFISKPFAPEEIKEAIKLMLRQAIDLKSTSNTVKGLIEQKAYAEAMKYVIPLFSHFPSSPIPHFLYGLLKEAHSEHEEALNHFYASNALDRSYEPSIKKIEEYRVKPSRDI